MAEYSAKKYSNALKNPVIEGTDAMIVPKGTSAERVTTTPGAVRYNTDNGVLEQYNATGWAGIDAAPLITNITGTINADTNSTITISGSNFKAGSIVSIEGAGVGGVARSVVTTYISSISLTFATNATAVNYTGGSAFNIRVTNPSGLSSVLENAGTIDRDPVWSTGAGNIATWGSGAARSVTVTATDPDSDAITYSVFSGSLPAGASLASATGVISGTITAVTSQTTYTFTIRATANGQTADRSFNIIVNPIGSGGTESTVNISGTNYRLHAFTSTGANTFTLNSDATVAVLIVAGGGAGGSSYGDQDTGKGGGGAGQVLVRTGYAITAGSYALTVGDGKAGRTGNNTTPPVPGTGGNSVGFGVTANGGGDGGGSDNYHAGPAQGGSGGGAGARNSTGSYNVGASSNKTTPASWTSYGNEGGTTANGNFGGGGGGGAGGAGATGEQNQNDSSGGAGGAGVNLSATFGTTYGVSGIFAGGGGGGCYTTGTLRAQSSGGSGGGGNGNSAKESSANPATQNSAVNINAVANTGGGGGGSSEDGQDANGNTVGGGSTSGSGGSGIIIVRYAI